MIRDCLFLKNKNGCNKEQIKKILTKIQPLSDANNILL